MLSRMFRQFSFEKCLAVPDGLGVAIGDPAERESRLRFAAGAKRQLVFQREVAEHSANERLRLLILYGICC